MYHVQIQQLMLMALKQNYFVKKFVDLVWK